MKVTDNLIKLKIPGQIPNNTVYRIHREENPPHLQVPRRTSLKSARTSMLINQRATKQTLHCV